MSLVQNDVSNKSIPIPDDILHLGTYGLPIPGGGEGLKTAICSIITCISQIPTKSYILFFASLKIFTFTFDFEISA